MKINFNTPKFSDILKWMEESIQAEHSVREELKVGMAMALWDTLTDGFYKHLLKTSLCYNLG